ncbi:unnamed protein product [Dovyalis caffra]|uniref:Uncharacterized protein n=1 Tax=Dovyalis caffra TaxID=77055 RepID=A0AAV1RC44_9ROSI|nr:unnamed protein product [Dovyalis caffra]
MKGSIGSSNLVKETYMEVKHPDFWESGSAKNTFGGFGWMPEFGVTRSWPKMFSMPYSDATARFPNYSVPLCIYDGGEIFECKQVLVIYNPKDGRCRYQ